MKPALLWSVSPVLILMRNQLKWLFIIEGVGVVCGVGRVVAG